MNTPSPQELARQLRKPEGPQGHEVAKWMEMGNAFLTELSYKHAQFQPDENILEIGIGNGNFLPSIKAQIGSGKLVGLDYSEFMVEAAKQNNADHLSQGFQIVHGALPHMPLENNSFDKVISINTLYFWDEPSTYLEDIKRVLTPTGKLILGFRTKESVEGLPFSQYGFTLYSLEEAKAFLTQEELTIEHCECQLDPKTENKLTAAVIVASV